MEADIRYPTDLELAGDATRMLAGEAAKVAELAGAGAPRVRNRSRAVAGRLRKLNRTLAARTGQGKPTALRLTGQAGDLAASVDRARRAAWPPGCASARGDAALRPSSPRPLGLSEVADRAAKVCEQITPAAWPGRRSPIAWSQ